jgi:hypothetical protein
MHKTRSDHSICVPPRFVLGLGRRDYVAKTEEVISTKNEMRSAILLLY